MGTLGVLQISDFGGRERFHGSGQEIMIAIRSEPADREVWAQGIAQMLLLNQPELTLEEIIEIRDLGKQRAQLALQLPVDKYGSSAFSAAASWAQVAAHAQHALDSRSQVTFLNGGKLPENYRGRDEG